MARDAEAAKQRQVLYWRLLATVFRADGRDSRLEHFDKMAGALAEKLGLPELILDPAVSIDTLVQRYPALQGEFERVVPAEVAGAAEAAGPAEAVEVTEAAEAAEVAEVAEAAGAAGGEGAGGNGAAGGAVAHEHGGARRAGGGDGGGDGGGGAEGVGAEGGVGASGAHLVDETSLRRALVYSKLLLNAFGPNTLSPKITAQQYSQWTQDLAWFEQAFGYPPGGLLKGRGRGAAGAGTTGTGMGRAVSDEELRRGLEAMEGDLVKRMALREVLKDSRLAAKLTPSMSLVEQILLDKANLSGEALDNARRLIRAYVDQLAEVLKLRVEKASRGKNDRAVPPKRTFRNLDLKRTVWKNLTNWNAREQRLYVDQLYYKRSSQKEHPTRMIVVVDQSGSMVDAMVQSTILASIFAGLPRVDVHLLAFDTRVLDLTEWVRDPFEVLLRTNLGGGTLIDQALVEAEKKIVEPKNTALVLISDFFEGGSDQVLLDHIKALKDSGVHFIPVGALSSGGHVMISEFFRVRLKELGMPVLSGSVDKLIKELRYLLR